MLDSEPTGDVTVSVESDDTKAATVSPKSLTFRPGDWNAPQTVTVTAVDDAVDNAGDERTATVTHTVSADGTDYEDETAASVAVTVNDDDGAPTLSIAGGSVDEGDSGTSTLRFTVSLTPASGKAVTVSYADAGTGTATSGTDYAQLADGTLSFAAGVTSRTVDVTVNGDDVDEGNETVVISLSSPSGAGFAGGASSIDATGTITDDDSAPAGIALSVDRQGVPEDVRRAPKVTVTATVAGGTAYPDAKTVTVSVGAAGDTAVEGVDYATVEDFDITVPAGAASAAGAFTLAPADDAIDEPDETVSITGSSGALTVSGTEIAITDDDAAPTGIALSLDIVEVNEDSDPAKATVTATVTGGTTYSEDRTVMVSVGATGDTAIEGMDYATVADFAFTVPAGDPGASGTFMLDPVDDQEVEADETVSVTARFDALPPAVESRVEGSEGRGVDGVAQLQGELSQVLEIMIRDDDRNGMAALDFSARSYQVVEGETLEVGITLSHALTTDTRVLLRSPGSDCVEVAREPTCATKGDDFPYLGGASHVIPKGETSITVPLQIPDDALVEGRERFSIGVFSWNANRNLTSDWEHGGRAEVIILDDDDGIWMSGCCGEVWEGGVAKTYDIWLNTDPGGAVTVTPESSDPEALTVTGSLTFDSANWRTRQTVSYAAVKDQDALDESVTVTHRVSGYRAVDQAVTVTYRGSGFEAMTVGPDFTVKVNDRHQGDKDGVAVEPAGLELVEAGAAGVYRVALRTRPYFDVTVTPMLLPSSLVSVTPEALTFTPDNWETPQAVKVTPGTDDDDETTTVIIGHVVRNYGDVLTGPGISVRVVEDGQGTLPEVSFAQARSQVRAAH